MAIWLCTCTVLIKPFNVSHTFNRNLHLLITVCIYASLQKRLHKVDGTFYDKVNRPFLVKAISQV